MLINAADLIGWAARRHSQENLPRLLRRLIRATVKSVEHIGFPSGDAIQTSGWDGIVSVAEGNEYVPAGQSVWELGTGQNTKQKADSDYEKRCDSPGEVKPAEATFVFVTPRRWPSKTKWAKDRKREGIWRDVRAYDADDLEQWLEIAPAVHIWASVLLGKRPLGVTDIEQAWLDWAEATEPILSSDLILAGREQISEVVAKWLEGPDATLALKAETRDEALALFLAAIRRLPDDEQEAIAARTAIVSDIGAWSSLASFEDPLILIAQFDVGGALAAATRKGHRVVVLLGRSDSSASSTIEVPKIKRAAAEKVLEAAGQSRERARNLAAVARRSLPALRRMIATRPEVQTPSWASPTEGPNLVPAVLAGQWTEREIHHDREILELLSGSQYDNISRVYLRWSNEADAPLRKQGEAWYVTSKQDAFGLLGRYLTKIDIDRLENAALRVFAARDPRYDLPREKRWAAAIYGKNPPHSGLLREGLAETLAWLGARGENIRVDAGGTAADYTTKIVREVLAAANADMTIWASLSSLLPLLAEASPDVYLSSLERAIASPEFASAMFTDAKGADSFGSSSAHPALLWSLETLAWNDAYLPAVTLLLAKLANIDPGGTLQNRPSRSLHQIFMVWYPQTAASVDKRLAVLELLRAREPNIAWSVLIGLLPTGHDVAFPTPKPKWREWAPEGDPKVTHGDIWRLTDKLLDWLYADVGKNAERWKDLLERFSNFSPERRVKLISQLADTEPTIEEDGDRVVIWSQLRNVLAHHRSFPDAEWRLSDDELDQLDHLYTKLAPRDLLARFGWVFTGWPELPSGRAYESEKDFEDADQYRLDAIKEVLKVEGVCGAKRLAHSVERPDLIGRALAQAGTDAAEILSLFANTDNALNNIARGFAFAQTEEGWKETTLDHYGDSWSGDQIGEFLSCWPSDRATWKQVERFPKSKQRYWRNFYPYGVAEDDREYVATQLLEHGRPYAAVTVLSREVRSDRDSVPAEDIMRSLEEAAAFRGDSDKPDQLFTFSVGNLLDYLFNQPDLDQDRLAAIEWRYLPALRSRERRPAALHAALRRSPRFFVDLVSIVYRGKDDEPRDLNEEDQLRGKLAHELLDSFRGIPGDAATIDDAALRRWVDEARHLLTDVKRLEVGDSLIGEFLSGSPMGADGVWPHEVVRHIIEDVHSDDLDRGIAQGIYNGRGVVTRSMYEGGSQERSLASTYHEYAEAIRDSSPRSAAVLDAISRFYERDARREDDDADLREDLD